VENPVVKDIQIEKEKDIEDDEEEEEGDDEDISKYKLDSDDEVRCSHSFPLKLTWV